MQQNQAELPSESSEEISIKATTSSMAQLSLSAADYQDSRRASESPEAPPAALVPPALLSDDQGLLERIARTYGTPTYCLDHNKLRYNCSRFKACLPDVGVFYAVKTNSAPSVLKTVFQQGCGFDFSSINDFKQVLETIKDLPESEQLSFIKEKTVYAHPVKSPDTLSQLDKYGVLATYDNIYEIPKIKQYAPHTRLLLRIATHNPASVYNLSSKFGCDIDEAMGLIDAAIKAGLTVEGISFHIGSQSSSPKAYELAFKSVLKIFSETAQHGVHLTKVDMGGGFPVFYGDKVCSLEDCAKVILPSMAQFPPDVKFYAEPGRVVVGDVATLVTSIVGKTYREGKQQLYLDDGLFGALTCTINDIRRPIYALKVSGELKPTVLFGPTSDPRDQICNDVQYPEMNIGDVFYVPQMGAYDITLSCHYNGLGEYGTYDHSFGL